jgi:DNA-binding IclR family transcriptional regulator
MSLLELLAASSEGLTLSEVSRELNIPKSTTHYLIYTLASRGYVQQISNRRYALGIRSADLGDAGAIERSLGTMAEPALRQIVARVSLTATVSILRGAEAVIVGVAKSIHDLGGGIWIGHHLDLHCTAQGKALVASLSDEELNKLFAKRELSRYTSKTIVSLPVLKAHLSEVRAAGFATNDEEQVLGCRAVAAPVVDSSGKVVACVSVRGTKRQIPAARLPTLGVEIIRAAHLVSLQIP